MIEVLVGLIASGKSTYCRQRAKEGWLIINDDDVVNMVHGGDYTLYDPALKPLYKSVEDHILHAAILMGKNVIIDRGLSISKAARSRWIALANSLDVPIQARVFPKEVIAVHARRRTESDSRGHSFEYWLAVAAKHNSQYQEPTTDEGFCKIEYEPKWEYVWHEQSGKIKPYKRES